MADATVSQLNILTGPSGRDLLYIVDVPVSNNSSNVSKCIDLETLFGNISSNTNINADLVVNGNTSVDVLTISENSTVICFFALAQCSQYSHSPQYP